MEQEKKKINKSLRYWKFILYPDSCGGGWESDVDYEGLVDRLEELGIQMFLSPVHNRDLDAEGCFKKSHIHVISYTPGKKSYSHMCDILKPFGVNTVLEVEDHERDEKYWCHLNCRNHVAKPEYSVEDCIALNGYQPTGITDLKTQSDMSALYRIVEDNGIVYFCDLANEILSNHIEMINSLNRFSAFFDRYLQSRERIIRMVRKENNNGVPITSLMSSYKSYRVKFGGNDA